MEKKRLLLTLIATIGILGFATAQTLPGYVPTNGLQGWWPFEGNGNDISGNLNNATNNGVTFIADRNGNPNAASTFNGTTANLQVPVPSFTFAETGAFSYSLWVKKQVQTSPGVILMIGTNTTDNFISLIQGMNEMQFGTNKQQSAWIWLSCPHTINVWDHYVATYNAGVMKLYKNDVLQGTTNYTYSGAITANMPLYFGQGVEGNFYTGDLDDVGIWNRELTQNEIHSLYVGCELSITSNPANQTVNLMGVAKFIVAASDVNATYQWQTSTGAAYQNINNTGQFSGATNDTLIVSNATLANNNQFFRCVVSLGTCNIISSFAMMNVNNSVDVTELTGDHQISVFPNPASNRINVSVNSVLIGSDYKLLNPLGKSVITGKIQSESSVIDISSIPKGVYFLSVGQNTKLKYKVVKK